MALTMSVGKYKDEKIEDLPSDYLKWLSENWSEEAICVAADEEYRMRSDEGSHWYN